LAIFPTRSSFPPAWFVDSAEGQILRPVGPGKIVDSTYVPEPGRYDIWIEGSFGRGYDVSVNSRKVGRIDRELSGRDEYGYVATTKLERGRSVLMLVRAGGSLRPGDGVLELLGPILLERRLAHHYVVRQVGHAGTRALCGRWLDWIEVVRR
jgi:hypothetical protein